jgi:preprotein translocase SecF subunit
MFQIISQTDYKFMSFRRHAVIFSGILIIAGLLGWLLQGGFNLGIDFAGGLMIEYMFNQELPLDEVRTTVSDIGYSGPEITDIQGNPKNLMIRVPSLGDRDASMESPSATILAALQAKYPGLEGDLRLEESVGPKIGNELRRKATLAVLISLLGILLYIAIRFEVKFALAAVLALFHDVLITLGIFAILQREITLPVIAALLTIGGYSVNDTIVVFDRIREQLKIRRRVPFETVLNISINQTLSRTIITSLTTLFAVMALFFLGGQVLHDFSLAMLIGIIIGTFSSIFVASSAVLAITNLVNRIRKPAAGAR